MSPATQQDTIVNSVKVHALQIDRPDAPPIIVILQPTGHHQGRLIVECGDQAWTKHFPHTGGKQLGTFVAWRHTAVLARELHPKSQKFSLARADYLKRIVREVQEVLRDLA